MTTTDPTASMGGPLSEAADMRREIVLREINQGALAGMHSEISEQAADLVLAALDRYDAWKAEQEGGDLAEVKAALRPGFAITLSQLIAEAQKDTHPLADAAGSTGPYVVQGCVVYGAQQLRDALRTVWKHVPPLLDELESARARVGVLEGQLATAQEQLAHFAAQHQPHNNMYRTCRTCKDGYGEPRPWPCEDALRLGLVGNCPECAGPTLRGVDRECPKCDTELSTRALGLDGGGSDER